MAVSQEMLNICIFDMIQKITNVRLQPNYPGVNNLNMGYQDNIPSMAARVTYLIIYIH